MLFIQLAAVFPKVGIVCQAPSLPKNDHLVNPLNCSLVLAICNLGNRISALAPPVSDWLSPLKNNVLEAQTTMKQKYSEEFVEQAVVKLLSRGKRTVREIALELNVNYHTAQNWMQRGSPNKAGMSQGKEKRAQDWRAQEQPLALQETHGLSGEALQAWSVTPRATRSALHVTRRTSAAVDPMCVGERTDLLGSFL